MSASNATASANAPRAVSYKGITVFRPPHQIGECDSTVPKFNYVVAQAGNMSGAFTTSGINLKFKLPKAIGTVFATTLRFLVNNATAAAVAAPPSPHWVESIEISIGSNKIETLYPDDIYNETVGFLSLDELGAVRTTLNASASDYLSGASLPVGGSYVYLPFNSCLTTARIYNKGIKEDVEFQVNFPANLFAGAAVTLSDLVLVVEEDTHSNGDEDNKWNSASNQTLVYNTVVRQRQTVSIQRTSGNKQTIDLTSLKGNSAGIIVYSNTGAKPNGSNAAALTARYPIDTLELNNQMGNKRTEELRGEWLRAYAWTDNIRTSYANAVPTYLIPFSANFRQAVQEGRNCGSILFESSDRLVLGAAAATRAENISITNYLYSQIVISGGKYFTTNQ